MVTNSEILNISKNGTVGHCVSQFEFECHTLDEGQGRFV